MRWTLSKFVNHFVVFALIMVSGNPAVDYYGSDLAVIGMFGVALALFLNRLHQITNASILMLTLTGAILLTHIAMFGNQVMNASISFMLQMLTAFMLVSTLPLFLNYFVRCMTFIAGMSLVFYFGFFLPGIEESLGFLSAYPSDVGLNIGIHNFRSYGYEMARNSGPFWEPGALAGYLAIALMVAAMLREKQSVSRRGVVVMIIALLTTLSTMGYVALMMVGMAYLVTTTRRWHPAMVWLGLPLLSLVLAIVSWQIAARIPFLNDKIETQITEANSGAVNSEINRFGNAMYDLSFIEIRPMLGWSTNVETRLVEDPGAFELVSRQGNDLTGMAVRFGVIGWALFMVGWVASIRRASHSLPFAIAAVGVISVTLVGEKYTNYPLIMSFFFLERSHVDVRAYLARLRVRNDLTVLQTAMYGYFRLVQRSKRLLRGRA